MRLTGQLVVADPIYVHPSAGVYLKWQQDELFTW